MHAQFAVALAATGVKTLRLQGTPSDRHATARAAIDQLIAAQII